MHTFRTHIQLSPTFPSNLIDNLPLSSIWKPQQCQTSINRPRTNHLYPVNTTLLTAAIGVPMGTWLIMNFWCPRTYHYFTNLRTSKHVHIIKLGMKKRYGVTLDWIATAKILFSSGVIRSFSEILDSSPISALQAGYAS